MTHAAVAFPTNQGRQRVRGPQVRRAAYLLPFCPAAECV